MDKRDPYHYEPEPELEIVEVPPDQPVEPPPPIDAETLRRLLRPRRTYPKA
jgi:hypothetical protein